MKKRFFVFVESNTSGTGRLFARTAVQLGYCPVVFAKDPSLYPYLQEDQVDFAQVDTNNLDALISRIGTLEKRAKVAGIYSSSEYFIEIAARLADLCGLPGVNHAAVSASRNKYLQRQYLQRAGISAPDFRSATSTKEALDALGALSLPVVVKPTFGTGSIGVQLCRNASDVFQHAETLLNRQVNERGLAVPRSILIEQYLVGPEYSVETFGKSVVGVTRKQISPEPYFVEVGHDFPGDLTPQQFDQVADTALRSLEAVGLNDGPAHVELRLTPTGPAIIEINPRLAGGFIPELVRQAMGVNMIRETIRFAVGNTPDLQSRYERHSSIRFLICLGNGVVKSIKGVSEAVRVTGVTDVRVYKTVGETLRIHRDFRDRIGHVISCADSKEAAVIAAEAGQRRIRIRLSASAISQVSHGI
jgi:biotin carboxylase